MFEGTCLNTTLNKVPINRIPICSTVVKTVRTSKKATIVRVMSKETVTKKPLKNASERPKPRVQPSKVRLGKAEEAKSAEPINSTHYNGEEVEITGRKGRIVYKRALLSCQFRRLEGYQVVKRIRLPKEQQPKAKKIVATQTIQESVSYASVAAVAEGP